MPCSTWMPSWPSTRPWQMSRDPRDYQPEEYRMAAHLSQSIRLVGSDGHTRLAVLDCCPYLNGHFVISRINVPAPHRGERIGAKLLRRCLLKADIWRVTMLLEVYPSGPLRSKALRLWYGRNGFVRLNDSRTMIREPQDYSIREREPYERRIWA